MTQHDFNTIFEHYPRLIAEMPDPFTSHQFLLHLAQQYQALYIEALYAYRNIPGPQGSRPFKGVHGILAKKLNAFSQLIAHVGEVESIDIFTQENRCAQWQKVRVSRPPGTLSVIGVSPRSGLDMKRHPEGTRPRTKINKRLPFKRT